MERITDDEVDLVETRHSPQSLLRETGFGEAVDVYAA